MIRCCICCIDNPNLLIFFGVNREVIAIRLQIMSDLHLEFHPDGGRSFLEKLTPQNVDVLVLAGDIHNFKGIKEVLGSICAMFQDVIFVFGNHECYHGSFGGLRAAIREILLNHPNLHFLDNQVKRIQGWNFVGTTLWFPYRKDNELYESKLNDFSLIQQFREQVYEENRLARHFLEEAVSQGSIVITHHLPSRRSITNQFRDDPLNRFFVCEIDPLIQFRKPALWIHGHAHESIDYQIGPTRILCNPYGYRGYMTNRYFTIRKTIEIPERQ